MHEGHRNRLRDRVIAQGIDSLEPHELLELYLYSYIPMKDTNSIAHELLESFGSISAVLDADVEDLMQIKNMTKSAATALHVIPQLIKIYLKDKQKPNKCLSSISCAVEYIKAETKFLTKERFYVMCLDTHFNLIKTVEIKSENVDRVNVSIKDVHSAVLRLKTKNVILAHNHPSGGLLPSDEDIALTRDIMVSMKFIDVEVLDHIIVTEQNYFSFREKGLLYEIMPKQDAFNTRYVAENNTIGERHEN